MKYFCAGGCGFILSSLINVLIEKEPESTFFIYDNLSSGNLKFLNYENSSRWVFCKGDLKDLSFLTRKMKEFQPDEVLLFASNADISKAQSNPTIDFYEGTLLVQNTLEAMRINNVKKIVYASGSGIYGNWDIELLDEDHSPMLPTSPYAANKLAGEALISAYSHMFGITARIYRFANVVGKNQTHGICFDLIRKLQKDKKELYVLGRGFQSKSYVHVNDIIDAILLTKYSDEKYNYYNVSYDNHIMVKEIVNTVLGEMGLVDTIKVIYGDTEGGWIGDIPTVRMDSTKIKNKGWFPRYTSFEAITKSVREMLGRE